MFGKNSTPNLSPAEKRFFCLAVVTTSFLLGLSLPQSTLARTWYIKADGTGDAPSIQAGVDSASAGDTVLVGPGTYSGRVNLLKDVSLIAEDTPANTVLDFPGGGTVILVGGVQSPTVIRGFRIQTTFSGYVCLVSASAPGRAASNVGISCGGSSIRITGNEIVDHDEGIALANSSAVVDSNIIVRAGVGLSCQANSNATIAYNHIGDCGDLIICYSSSPTIIGNDLVGGCFGLECVDASFPTVTGNHFSDAQSFAIKSSGSSLAIEDNVFDWGARGLFLASCSVLQPTSVRGNVIHAGMGSAVELRGNPGASIVIENNMMKGAHGVGCDLDSSPLIQNNILIAQGYGVWCWAGSNPTIACNDVVSLSGTPYGLECQDQTGIYGNFSLDPQFCGIEGSGNYFLQSDSPCAPANHPDGYECGLIGARPVLCGTTGTKAVTWGSLKSKYAPTEEK